MVTVDPTILAVYPLMSIVPLGPTSTPAPGHYYETGDQRMLLCTRVVGAGIAARFVFVEADSPVTVLTAQELAAQPLQAVDLVPSRRSVAP